MSKWDKLITRICNLSKDLRFDELRKVLESCGYEMNAPKMKVDLWFLIRICLAVLPVERLWKVR